MVRPVLIADTVADFYDNNYIIVMIRTWLNWQFHHQFLWARGSEPVCRDNPKTRWQLQSMYQRLHGNFITGKKNASGKQTKSPITGKQTKALKAAYICCPQPTVALRVTRSYSKVAYLKRLKSRIVHLIQSFFLLLQPVQHLNARSDTVKTAIDCVWA